MRQAEQDFINFLKREDDSLNQKEVEDFLKSLSHFINCFPINTDEMIDAIRDDTVVSKKLNAIGWKWIQTAAEEYEKQTGYDARNEIAYKRCFKLYDTDTGKQMLKAAIPISDSSSSYPKKVTFDNLPLVVSLYMKKEHRTLQQVFTGFLFTYFLKTDNRFSILCQQIGLPKMGYMVLI